MNEHQSAFADALADTVHVAITAGVNAKWIAWSKPLRLASVKEACAYAKCGATKLYELMGEGKIAARRMFGKTMIDLDSVDAWHHSLPKIDPSEFRNSKKRVSR